MNRTTPSFTRHVPPGLVCFALPDEARPFRLLAAGLPEVEVLVTGMGRTNTERAFRGALAAGEPALVLTCGFAGALDPELRSGEVVFEADEGSGLKEKLAGAGAREAHFHCAERIATTAAEKRGLRQTTGADAVEMESEVVRRMCRERGIPSATVRVISDTAEEDLPLDFNLLMTEDQRLDRAKFTGAIVKNPGRIPALLRLERQTRLAAKQLARVLGKALAQ